jgi:hypothetical protein
LEDPNVVIKNYKNTKVIRAESKGTIMKSKSGFLSNKSKEPLKSFHGANPARTIPQRGLRPLLEKSGDGGEPGRERITSFLGNPRKKRRSKRAENFV